MIVVVIAQPEYQLVFFIGPIGVVQAMGSVEMSFSENGDSHDRGGW
jgi:hypothetical protein